MFERFYTTKMSTSGKELRLRFERIRRGKGKSSRFAGVIMAGVMTAVLACGTVVMAAVGEDGFEYWDTNECYYSSGMNFSINVSGSVVPEWVKNIAGSDGNIYISISKYKVRDTSGFIHSEMLGNFSGTGGAVLFTSHVQLHDPGEASTYTMYFSGAFEGMSNDFNIIPDDGRRVKITCSTDENKLIDSANVEFFEGWPKVTIDASKVAESVFTPEKVNIIGDFSKQYIYQTRLTDGGTDIFLDHEIGKYKNRHIDGIDVSVESADNTKIKLRIKTTEQIKGIDTEIYDPELISVSSYSVYESDQNGKTHADSETFIPERGERIITVEAPELYKQGDFGQHELPEENLSGSYISGKTYLITLAMIDETHSVIYRWQDYVTIP